MFGAVTDLTLVNVTIDKPAQPILADILNRMAHLKRLLLSKCVFHVTESLVDCLKDKLHLLLIDSVVSKEPYQILRLI